MLALFIALAWKSGLIAAIALLGTRAMHGRPAAERVFLLRLAVAMLLALPVATLLLPPLDLAVLPAIEMAQPLPILERHVAAVVTPSSPPRASFGGTALFVALYVTGVAALLLHLVTGIVTLGSWTRRAAPVDDPQWQAALGRAAARFGRPVRLRASGDVASPLSWGVVPAWILIDTGSLARGERAEAVIAHEAAHIRRFDWPMLIATRVAVALFWANPLVWLLARALGRESEVAADEAAIRSVARVDYAQALLAFAKVPAGHRAATGMALWPGALGERIARIVEMPLPRRASRMVLAALLLCGTGATPLLAAMRFVRVEPLPREKAVVPQVPAPMSSAPWAPLAPEAPKPGAESVSAAQPGISASDRPTSADPQPSSAVPAVTAVPAAVSVQVPAPVAAPAASAPVRIVGKTGAVVETGPAGITLIGGTPEDSTRAQIRHGQEEALRGQEEARRGADEGRRGAAEGLRGTAVGLRAQADELERVANEPNQLRGVREGNLKAARDLRSSADKLEKEADKLTGG